MDGNPLMDEWTNEWMTDKQIKGNAVDGDYQGKVAVLQTNFSSTNLNKASQIQIFYLSTLDRYLW